MLNECTCAHLRRLTRRITTIYDHHLAPVELTISQYSLLSRVGRLGPIANLRLAGEMGMDRSTLSRTIKPLMSAGWITTADMPPGEQVDKRSFGLELTAAGRAKRDQAYPLWHAAEREISDLMGGDVRNTLIGVVEQAYDKLQQTT